MSPYRHLLLMLAVAQSSAYAMPITADSAVCIKWSVTSLAGETIEPPGSVACYFQGHKQMFPKLESALAQKSPGERVSLKLQTEDVWGPRRPELLKREPRSKFPPGTKIGSFFETDEKSYHGTNVIYRVVEIQGDTVVVDGNHPLAGKGVMINAVVQSVRAPTPEERASGFQPKDAKR